MSIIESFDFTHPLDRQTLDSLKAIPGFTKATKAYMRLVSDRKVHMSNMSSKILLGPNQLPEIYRLLPPVCERLGIEVPPLYLELSSSVNARTSGDNIPEITLTSSLLDIMSDEEIQIIMAHECGHIICHHVLYMQLGRVVLAGASGALGIPIVSQALEYAFAAWMRCSELSADRAAGLFAGDEKKVARVLMRLSGCPSRLDGSASVELFMRQAESYDVFLNDSGWNRFLGTMAYMEDYHPLNAVRANEIAKWMAYPEVRRVIDDLDSGVFKPSVTQFSGQTAPPAATEAAVASCAGEAPCPKCGAANQPGSAFCAYCGTSMASAPTCPSCGAQQQFGARFCAKCGSPVAAPGTNTAGVAARPQEPSRRPFGQKGTDKIRENLNQAQLVPSC